MATLIKSEVQVILIFCFLVHCQYLVRVGTDPVLGIKVGDLEIDKEVVSLIKVTSNEEVYLGLIFVVLVGVKELSETLVWCLNQYAYQIECKNTLTEIQLDGEILVSKTEGSD